MPTRKEILHMLARGEIDVNRATEMLNTASEEPEPAAPVRSSPKAKEGRRWLHVQVSDLESGKSRVRVNVPLGLVHFGLKVGARFTDEVDSDIIHDVLDLLHDEEISGTLVEVEDADDNERVHIYVD